MGEWQRCDNNAVWKDSGVRVKLQGEGVRVTDECLKRVCQECGVDIAEVIVEEWKELWIQVEPEAKTIQFGE